MHAHSDYTITVHGSAEERTAIHEVLHKTFKNEKNNYLDKEDVIRNGKIKIKETYEVVFLEDITKMALSMAEAAIGSQFTIDGTIDTSESAGEYMNFYMSYISGKLEVKSSVWYYIIGDNTSYEEFCELHDDENSDEHMFSFEEFKNGNYFLERGSGELVSEVPLDKTTIIELEHDNDKDDKSGSSTDKDFETDIHRVLSEAREQNLSLEESEQFLLNINWTDHTEEVEEVLKGIVSQQRSAFDYEEYNESADLAWETADISKKNVKITKYIGNQKVVVVPETIGDKTVTEIGDYAFSVLQPRISKDLKASRANITKVLIPDSVNKIGKGLFRKLEKIETIVLPGGLKTLTDETFMECKKLKYVMIPETVTHIGGHVFAGCDSLLMAYLPDSIKRAKWIDKSRSSDSVSIFVGCSSLKKAKMPRELQGLSLFEFGGCEELEEVILPTELKKIDTEAFERCSKLSKLDLPEGLERIGFKSFADCKSLNNLRIPSSVIKIDKTAFEGIKKINLLLKEGSPIIEFAEKNKISYSIE